MAEKQDYNKKSAGVSTRQGKTGKQKGSAGRSMNGQETAE
jgi:hypothetical protein